MDDGMEFYLVEPAKIAGVSVVARLDESGAMVRTPLDVSEPHHLGRPELQCGCGHQWVTSRKVSNER
jgi:hypothetical protein